MKNLIHSLIKIELFQLKKICPLVCKNTRYPEYVTIDHYSIDNQNRFIVNDKKTPIDVSKIYFVNGYNNYVSFKDHISIKYNVRNWE